MQQTGEAAAVAVVPGKTKNRLMEHAGLLLSATLVAGVTNYVFHIVMSRNLGPQGYGVLFSLLSLFMIFAFPLSTVQMVLTKYVAQYRGQGNDPHIRYLYGDLFKKLAAAAVVLFGLFVLLSGKISSYLQLSANLPVLLIAAFTFLSFLMPVILGMLQGLEHFFYLSLNSAVGALSKLGLAVGFVALGLAVNGALLACVLSVLVSFVMGWLPLRDYLRRHAPVAAISSKEMYSFCLPVLGALTFYGLLAYPDVVLVKHWFSQEAAGAYATAALLGKAFLFPAQSLAMAMYPKVSQMSGRGEETRGMLRHTMLLAAAILGAGLLVVFLFPELFSTLLLKRGKVPPELFEHVSGLLRLYALAFVPVAASYILVFYELGRHRKGFVLVLGGGTVLFLGLAHAMHGSPEQVLAWMGIAGAAVFALLFIGSFRK